MTPRRVLPVLSFAVILELATGCFGSDQICAPVTPAESLKLTSYIAKRYQIALPDAVKIEDLGTVEGSCYRTVRFTDAEQRGLNAVFILAPDHRMLTTEVFDSAVDPIEERARQRQHLKTDLLSGRFASLGPEDAQVTLTVFSDFQCPYCKAAALVVLKDVLSQTNRDRTVRLIFRNLPLPMHSWARTAAESMACIERQSNSEFWRLHDYLFANQQSISPENLQTMLLERLRDRSSVDLESYNNCVAGHLSRQQVEDDLRLAAKYNVSATPTLFVDDVRVTGALRSEQVKSFIRQAR